MTDLHRPVLSPDTLTRLAGAMAEFSSAWAGDVAALRTAESELSATKALLVAANLRIDDLQGDLDGALADNRRLNERNAFLEAQVQLISDRALDAEKGMAAVRDRVGQTLRVDGTTKERPAPAPVNAERMVALAREIESRPASSPSPALVATTRPVREIDSGSPDGTGLPQDPVSFLRRTVPPSIDFAPQQAALS